VEPLSASILIIEDDVIIAEDLRGRLLDAGYDVVGIADRGETALMLAEDLQPQVAIVDIMLKDAVDGISVGQYLAERGVAVIHLTALFERALRETRGYAVELLAKPFTDEELLAAVEKALRPAA
jgi:DNA-binding response OmpR family regulator